MGGANVVLVQEPMDRAVVQGGDNSSDKKMMQSPSGAQVVRTDANSSRPGGLRGGRSTLGFEPVSNHGTHNGSSPGMCKVSLQGSRWEEEREPLVLC